MEPLNGLSSLKIALLIDFDNVLLGIDDPGFDVELVVNALRERGSIVMGRCYGDWYRHNRHRRKLMEQGLELVETPAFGPVIKNSADIRIALDGLEIGMTQHHIDTFCLVSGDSDFLPLIKKLQYLGKQVLVICGNRFTSDMLRRNCNEFISYENLLAKSVGATEDATTLEGAFALLHRAMEALRERGAEIRSSTVKQMMLQLNPVFSERNFGCPQFRGFLDKAVAQGLIKLGSRDRTSGEFSVLLPEEEEKFEAGEVRISEAKIETKPERAPRERAPRTPREPREPRESRTDKPLNGVTSSPALTPETAPEPIVRAPGSDLFVPAEQSEADDHSTTSAALMSRGLRRGRLKFSGKTGRPEKLPDTPITLETFGVSDETTDEAPESQPIATLSSPESVTEPVTETMAGEAPATVSGNSLEELAQNVAQAAADLSVGTVPPPDMGTSPAVEAAVEARAEADMPKKPARRRTRRKTSVGEKGVADTAPATEAEAKQNERDADAIGLSIPGQAFEVASSEVAPSEPAPTAEAVAAPEATEAAPEPAVKAPKKPTRRRSPRKKADGAA